MRPSLRRQSTRAAIFQTHADGSTLQTRTPTAPKSGHATNGNEVASTAATRCRTATGPSGRTRRAVRGGAEEWTASEGLPDVYISMDETAANVPQIEGITRQEQDEWGLRSLQRALQSQKNGFFEHEITPIDLPDGRTMTADDGPRLNVSLEKMASLEPVFRPDGRGHRRPLRSRDHVHGRRAADGTSVERLS